ncbi:MAG: sigma 54 modulation/S30EA ribosomal C-terminal domain-containing protein, partial [Oscillospiraceae bacterium]
TKRLREADFENYNVDIAGTAVEDEAEEFKIIKTKRLSAKPMMVEEAILQMNMLGHDFFIFTNPETMEPNIVYKRKRGNYALIETF